MLLATHSPSDLPAFLYASRTALSTCPTDWPRRPFHHTVVRVPGSTLHSAHLLLLTTSPHRSPNASPDFAFRHAHCFSVVPWYSLHCF